MIDAADILRRIAHVAHARQLGFVELVGLAELDPATAFVGAVLRGNMRGQDLRGFNFTGAEFRGCDLTGAADLTWAEGVTPEMLDTAIVDGETKRPRAHFWATGTPPAWAEDWGRNPHGPWCTFRVPGTDITQRLRWCPPGEFIMGSPPNETGRGATEGPQHKVRFAQGFWMFETACTEALWIAVTGKQPDPKWGTDRPVTTVSWTDANDFAERLNAMLLGLSLGLPSEARWEYACRAGTDTPYSFGARVTKKQANFGGRAGPVAVGSLPANPWGFHEMHGNVWEWCEDAWNSSYEDAPADGTALIDTGPASRVIRGGCWYGNARLVRASYRDRSGPSHRFGSIGFRLARVQNSDQRSAGGVAAPADPASAASAERRKPAGAAGDATPPKRPSVISTRGPEKPNWAEKVGTDQYGTYADLAVATGRGRKVRQRLRLILPGSFPMGSPDDEPGRYNDEGPRQRVDIRQAFWLFDTPCTQQLWRAMTGENPSYFRSATRPVETVGFDDVSAFLARLNDRVSDLNLTLPSEAQWEYACRAGTEAATYAGPIESLGAHNAPVLDAIAWYGGNSGQGYDLRKGFDRTGWPECQYDDKKAGTRKVKAKQPNSWGLYDMLGNVWEWCEDVWQNSYDGAPIDGSARPAANSSASRVLRGGSWDGVARGVRSAVRSGLDPSNRLGSVGFRCARVQNSDQRPGAEPDLGTLKR